MVFWRNNAKRKTIKVQDDSSTKSETYTRKNKMKVKESCREKNMHIGPFLSTLILLNQITKLIQSQENPYKTGRTNLRTTRTGRML